MATQIRPGDRYELSRGHSIYCAPTGGAGSQSNRLGASVVGWDPAVKEAGVDTGYAPEPGMLRAPDVAVGNVPNAPGWVHGVPDLAIEYADVGQDEGELQEKIRDLLSAGTKHLWVVRLTGLRRVEIHEPGKKMRTAMPGDRLEAGGVLKNPVPVEALYERDAAERATLTNLLQRRGFDDLEAVLAEGRREGIAEGKREGLDAGRREGIEEGKREGLDAGRREGLDAGRREGLVEAILTVLDARGVRVSKAARARIERSRDAAELERWVRRAAVAESTAALFGGG